MTWGKDTTARMVCNGAITSRRNRPMQLLKQLFTTEVGLFSAVGIGIMLCMAGFFLWLFTRDDAPKDKPHP
ncbi:ABC-type Fe3+ transport system, permease component [Acidovorax sp. MR-S7]|nr:ABC-type Fe3+ transport system, permease component [Acidovorax sp. MR-S7]